MGHFLMKARLIVLTLLGVFIFMAISMSVKRDPEEGNIWTMYDVARAAYVPPTAQGVYPTNGTFGVSVQNTVFVTGIPAGAGGGGTAFINNTPGVVVVSQPSAIITGTVNVNIVAGAVGGGTVAVNNTVAVATPTYNVLAFPAQTFPVSLPTIGAQIFNTPAVQPPAALAQATTTAGTLPNVQITPALMFPVLEEGYDSTSSNNAYRAVSVDASGNQGVNVKNTPAIQGTVSIQAAATIPASLPTIGVIIAATAPVSTSTAWVVFITPVPISTGSANFFINVAPQATFPIPTSTLNAAVWVQNSVVVATATQNVAAWIQNTVAVATATLNAAVWVQNTPAVQGSVSINNTPQVQFATADPCENPGIAKSFVALATGSATTSPLVAVNGSQNIYVCGFVFTEPQGVGTVGVQFMDAVNTPCSSLTPLTGVMALGVSHPGGYAQFKANKSLCIQKTGAGVDPEGVLSYVQQ